MHETLSPSFKGYIDKVDVTDDNITVYGWVVGINNYIDSDVGILDAAQKTFIPCKVSLYQRADVYSFYNQQSISYLNSGFCITFPIQTSDLYITIKKDPVFVLKY
jgi:hypothetical protein